MKKKQFCKSFKIKQDHVMVWNIYNIVLFRRIENLIRFEIGW